MSNIINQLDRSIRKHNRIAKQVSMLEKRRNFDRSEDSHQLLKQLKKQKLSVLDEISYLSAELSNNE